MKKIKEKLRKLIRKLFFKYCYKPQSINAKNYNIIPINACINVDEGIVLNLKRKERKEFEDNIKHRLALIIADEIGKTVKLDEYYLFHEQEFVYKTKVFIAEDKYQSKKRGK